MLQSLISLVLGNFSLVMLILAMVVTLITVARKTDHSLSEMGETAFRWLSLLAVGVPGIYTAICHIAFPERAAEEIGWATSPFQFEVGNADLTVGVLGILAFRASTGFRLATTIAATCWLGGDAVGHIYQMIAANNFAPGNAGSWFWTDVLVPLLLIAAYRFSRSRSQAVATRKQHPNREIGAAAF